MEAGEALAKFYGGDRGARVIADRSTWMEYQILCTNFISEISTLCIASIADVNNIVIYRYLSYK